MGLDPLPTYIPPYESVERDPELVARYPLTLISSPAHTFLNTTFANLTSLRRQAHEPEVLLHPADAERRGISAGDGDGAQRPRRVRGEGARGADDPRGRGVGAVDLVGQARGRRRERESDHVAAGDRSRTRSGVLRQSGRGRGGGGGVGGLVSFFPSRCWGGGGGRPSSSVDVSPLRRVEASAGETRSVAPQATVETEIALVG